jgi:hypothetical protein
MAWTLPVRLPVSHPKFGRLPWLRCRLKSVHRRVWCAGACALRERKRPRTRRRRFRGSMRGAFRGSARRSGRRASRRRRRLPHRVSCARGRATQGAPCRDCLGRPAAAGIPRNGKERGGALAAPLCWPAERDKRATYIEPRGARSCLAVARARRRMRAIPSVAENVRFSKTRTGT